MVNYLLPGFLNSYHYFCNAFSLPAGTNPACLDHFRPFRAHALTTIKSIKYALQTECILHGFSVVISAILSPSGVVLHLNRGGSV
jgi:hypothetical protein